MCGFKKAESFTVNKKIEKNEKYLKIIDTSYLSQKIFFEDTTLIDNLLIGEEKNEFNKNKIIELMKKLKLENFISELDKKVEFDGSNFSLGEQQRFLIIRSILKKPKVLILDEPFSSLDKENQKNLIEFLMEYKNKFTLIMSTHVNFSSDLFDLNFQIKDKKLEAVIMYCIILAGGLGTRISSESIIKPKPMIEILYRPILLRIIDFYKSYGINKFIISSGYKHKYIVNYFKKLKNKNLYLDLKGKNKFDKKILDKFYISKKKNKFFIKIFNTGLKSETGGRIFHLKKILSKENNFLLTYGDGLSNVNLKKLIQSHNKYKPIVTVTSVKQPSRFGQTI